MKSIFVLVLMLSFVFASAQSINEPIIEKVTIIEKTKQNTLVDKYKIVVVVSNIEAKTVKQINITRVNDSRKGAEILIGTILPIDDSISRYPIRIELLVPNDAKQFIIQAQIISNDPAALRKYTKPVSVRIND